MPKLFYIVERHNPQFKKPYYIKCGQLSKKEAKAKGSSIYGTNYLLTYQTEQEYNDAIELFKAKGFNVN
jgi:hypothetical protein